MYAKIEVKHLVYRLCPKNWSRDATEKCIHNNNNICRSNAVYIMSCSLFDN